MQLLFSVLEQSGIRRDGLVTALYRGSWFAEGLIAMSDHTRADIKDSA